MCWGDVPTSPVSWDTSRVSNRGTASGPTDSGLSRARSPPAPLQTPMTSPVVTCASDCLAIAWGSRDPLWVWLIRRSGSNSDIFLSGYRPMTRRQLGNSEMGAAQGDTRGGDTGAHACAAPPISLRSPTCNLSTQVSMATPLHRHEWLSHWPPALSPAGRSQRLCGTGVGLGSYTEAPHTARPPCWFD